ncbi:V4R domain-containing protein [Candidatus Palauibacter sp.]|uniref:V4R domain-containing protein n=1 Tax=Candidatus Palauibacter sp. TaxID=3101350 RepID=UPI003B51F51E
MILPRSVLSGLFHRCASLGDAGVAALKEAGDRTGGAAVSLLGDAPDALPAARFWALLDEILRKAGLGSVAFKPGGAASAAIAWRDSAEAAEGSTGEASGARCHFATGLLRGVLSRLAGRVVEVAEVRCGGGTEPCWFLIGSVETMQRVQAGGLSATGSGEH